MSKELFTMAAQEQEASPYKVKQQKYLTIAALLFSAIATGYGIYVLIDFQPGYSTEILFTKANQIVIVKSLLGLLFGASALIFSLVLRRNSNWLFLTLLILMFFEMGLVVFSDTLGFDLVTGKGLVAAYAGCIGIPILTIILIIEKKRKHR